MPTTNAERDIERAEGLRQLAKRTKSEKAKRELGKAADRFEERGAAKASKLGRLRRKSSKPASSLR